MMLAHGDPAAALRPAGGDEGAADLLHLICDLCGKSYRRNDPADPIMLCPCAGAKEKAIVHRRCADRVLAAACRLARERRAAIRC